MSPPLSKPSSVVKIAVLAALMLPAANAADSQQDPNPHRAVPIPHPLTVLLRDNSVRRELGLRADQAQAATVAIEEIELPLWRLRNLPPDKRRKQDEILVRQLKSNLGRILSDGQHERLNQIVWQFRGTQAILDPETIHRLRLSRHQVTQIRNYFTELANELRTIQQDPNTISQSQDDLIGRLHVKTEEDILAVLTEKQRQILSQLIGPEFDLSHVRLIACKAPPLQPAEAWINTNKAQTLMQFRGKVTVVHFYAFGCINCKRTLPYYNKWKEEFPANHFQIIGIHRPETKQERIIEKVKEKASEYKMEYPIAVDNKSLNWNAWANSIWPGMYLVDKNGFVRYWWYGELNYKGTPSEKWMRDKISELLKEDYSALAR